MAADKRKDKPHLSSKLQTMKFMQRSADRAKADAEKKLEKKRISESHWTASYSEDIVPEEKTKVRVVYETSYLKMPKGSTTVRANGSPSTHSAGCSSSSSSNGDGDGAKAFVGRRSFKSFNKEVEKIGEEAAAQQLEQLTEEREKLLTIDDQAMARTLAASASSTNPEASASLRAMNKQFKRKRD
ncbi:hypothetical protein GGI12_002032 [Dipsacomyces acuminosporus]|nr:hypothetical protein GGI12_002032 [Dipsacomyces acuminosporus]